MTRPEFDKLLEKLKAGDTLIVHTYLEIKSDDETGWGKKERIREDKAREIYSYPKLREYVNSNKKIEIKAVVVKKVDGTYRKLLLPEIRL